MKNERERFRDFPLAAGFCLGVWLMDAVILCAKWKGTIHVG